MSRRKTIQSLTAMMLSVIMVMGMMPLSALAETSTFSIGASGEITAFEALGSDITVRSVPLGTSEADLALPDILTAVIRLAALEEEPMLDSGKADTALDSTDTAGGAAIGVDETDDIETGEEAKIASPSDAKEAGDRSEAEPTEKTVDSTDEMTVPLPVTWASSPEYDGEAAGTYVFTPELPEGFTPASGVETPIITVTVAAATVITGTVTAFDELPDGIRWQNTTAPEFPEEVGGTVEGEAASIPVSWEADHDYDADYPARGLYVFTAILGEGYDVADGVELPRITVYIPQATGRMARMAGAGTGTSPLEITTAAQLAEIATLVNARENGLELFLFNNAGAKVSLKLMNDLDLSAYSGGGGWAPIGGLDKPFKGALDGGGHKISNLTIDRNGMEYQGLFGYIGADSLVENLGVENATIVAKSCVGGVAGYVDGGMVQNCYATGSIVGKSYIGGLAGCVINNSTVKNCYAASSIVGLPLSAHTGSYMIGGLAGGVYDSTAKNCYVIGNVTGNVGSPSAVYTGGLAGYFVGEGTIQNCAALNQTVVGAHSIGRVTGSWSPDFPVGNRFLSDNLAFYGMTVTEYDGAKTLAEGADQVDGESKTAADIKAAGFFEALFNYDTAWTYEEGKLPGFGAAVDMPLHLLDDTNPFAGGNGSEDDPYEITTPAQLAKLAELVNAGNTSYNTAHYRLMNDLDLSAYGKDYDDGKGWTPIGNTYEQQFKGIFDGNGKTITELYINQSGQSHVGLFGSISRGTAKNLALQNVSIKGLQIVGGVTGSVYEGGMVQGCFVSGIMSGADYIGGVVGFVYAATVENCHSAVSLTSTSSNGSGGIIGRTNFGTIKNCYSIGSIAGVAGNGGIGGVVGVVFSASVQNCAALNPSVSGNPTGVRRVAGSFYSNILSGNIAFIGMTVNGSTVSDGTLTDHNGAPKTAEDINAASFWTTASGFTADWNTTVWEIAPGKLPILKGIAGQNASMPEHLLPAGASVFEGAGTSEGDPYLIKTAADLAKLAQLVNEGTSPYADPGRYYRLEKDLDLSSYASGEGWMPIGASAKQFKGIFDGNNKTITGLTINRPAADNIGLFGYLYIDSKVQNIRIIDASVIGKARVGGVAGYVWGATVENCAVTGNISGVESVGGAVGRASSGTVQNCYSTGSVTGSGDYVGGIIGYLEYAATTVQRCYSDSRVSGNYYVGGVAGEVGAGSVGNCYSTGNVTGGRYVGGVAGSVGSGSAQNCYSTGSVLGTDSEGYIGGVLGVLGTAKNCVALNPSINAGAYNFGRVVGSNSGSLLNNYAFSRMPGIWANKGLSAKDGEDVTSQTLFGGSFWTTAGNWDTAAWDSAVWTFEDGKLPTLKGLAGQNGDGGLYLTARDIQYAAVAPSPTSFAYNGSEQIPILTVTFDGETLRKDTDYTVSINSTDGGNTSAGINAGEVTLTLTGIGSFKGTKTATYTIDKASLIVLGALINPKIYDGTTAAGVANVYFHGLQPTETLALGTDYTVMGAQFNSADAGDNKTVTATVSLTNTAKANNYALAGGGLSVTGLIIGKAAAPAVPDIAKAVLYTDTASQTVHIADHIASYKRTGDALTYTVGAVSGTNPGIIQTPSVNAAGVLTFTANGSVGDTATIPVTVKDLGNYNNITVNVAVTLTDKIPVTITATMNGGVYTGSAYSYTGAIAKRNDNNADVTAAVTFEVQYESTDGGGYSGAAAPINAGAYKLTLSVPATDTTYAGSAAFNFTIEKRPITLAADNKTIIKSGGLPELTYTVRNLPAGKLKADALSIEPVLACPTFDGNTPGSYAITLTGGTATDNYTITTRTGGALTVAEQTYVVTFNLNGGTRTGGGELTQTVANGSAAIPPAVSRSNYTFTGWDKAFTNVTSNLTVTAGWRYDSGGDDSTPPTTPSTTPPAAPTPEWLEQSGTSEPIADAKEKGLGYTLTRRNGRYGVRKAAWSALAGYQYWHDTMDASAVQVRIYIRNPAALASDLLVSGYVKGSEADGVKAIFEKWFKNKVCVIHLDQAGPWGQSVGIAARVNLTGMDMTKLVLYSYDKATKSYRRIEKPAYWVDTNGYLHFITQYAGDIIISEGALTLIEKGETDW